ncbi:hypothetical protein RSOLAG1IB_04786 [Rhizoctonia solani AG-1 IB]|uniref:Uncharacterized protein n=1 Tax=Thanatephorus cucumeris (strain AG1-IB / isolate 7/3/14) TaxID=1108050 RepID=A0A0B7FXH8_THACB|nr:hypothetical protein RSOLAG1IB_04786 [Rhizoctonia solani AG-1 IB]
MNDAEVLTQIADYFLNPEKVDMRVNGVIYIHQAGDTLRSRSLSRIFKVLSKVFLGPVGLSRLTFLVACDNIWEADPAIVDEFYNPSSPFSDAIARGARVEIFDPEKKGFQTALKIYTKKQPISLPIQQSTRMTRPEFVSHMENLLGYFEMEAAQCRLMAQETNLRDSSDFQLKQLKSELESKTFQLDQCRERDDRHAALGDQIAALNQKLLEVHQEYSSLRSQLQLQENFEQGEIVQEFKDLNRRIDDIGRSLSAHLADKYVSAVFNKDLGEVTALEAHNLSGLKSLLGYNDYKPSLVSLDEEVGMDIESFLDFSTRTLLCKSLHVRLFQPFHPFIPIDQSKALCDAYSNIQEQELQATSGKWRSNTFKSIYRPSTANEVEDRIKEIALNILITRLNPLFTHVFGEIDGSLEALHFDKIQELVGAAWKWNAKLKGEVIMLGDFRTTTYDTNFNPAYMEEFEPGTTKNQAQYVLGTLGLGLISQRAVGGQLLEETVVCKALVATEHLYL